MIQKSFILIKIDSRLDDSLTQYRKLVSVRFLVGFFFLLRYIIKIVMRIVATICVFQFAYRKIEMGQTTKCVNQTRARTYIT